MSVGFLRKLIDRGKSVVSKIKQGVEKAKQGIQKATKPIQPVLKAGMKLAPIIGGAITTAMGGDPMSGFKIGQTVSSVGQKIGIT
jgi:hypothetical protein